MRTIVRILVLALISILYTNINISHAFEIQSGIEIDLSSLSGTNGESHNHIWEAKYDSTNHWDECKICKTENNKLGHSLSSKYTISSTSCNPNNRKITYCSGCEYTIEEKTSNKHTMACITHTTIGFYTHCSVCRENYCNSWNGSIYKYTNGVIADHNNLSLPATLINELGERYTLTTKRITDINTAEIADNCKFDYTINGDKIYVNAEFKLTQDVLRYVDTNRMYDNNYAYLYCFTKRLAKGNEGGNIDIQASSRVWDSSTNTLKATFVINMRDSNKNYNSKGSIQPTIMFNIPIGNYQGHFYYCDAEEEIATNFTDPIINDIDFS